MATPSEKSPQMEQFLENLMGRTTAIQLDYCVICRKPATEFRDAVSRKEYTLSGFCQRCQDETFGPAEDEEDERVLSTIEFLAAQRFGKLT